MQVLPEDNFLILACDGVFSAMSNSEVRNHILSQHLYVCAPSLLASTGDRPVVNACIYSYLPSHIIICSKAVAFVQRRLLTHQDAQRASRELARKAMEMSCDDFTCVVICLNQVCVMQHWIY